jgi:hypothetical protein
MAPVPPPPLKQSPKPVRNAGLLLPLLVGGVAVCVLVGAGAFFVVARGRAAPSAGWEEPPAYAPAVTTAKATAARPTPAGNDGQEITPKASLARVREGRTSIGGLFWLATYTNSGTVPIADPSAVASLFDATGKRVAEQPGYAVKKLLAPGESTPMLILVANAPKFAKAVVNLRDPEAPRYARDVLTPAVKEFTVGKGRFGRSAVGTVRNDQQTALRFIQIVVVGRDAQGDIVSYADGYATAKQLAPGQESGFDISLGTFEIEKPAKWEAFAVASPAK